MTDAWWLAKAALTFTWDLWYSCGYRCSYCWWEMEGLWEKLARTQRILPPEDWLAVWGRIRRAHGEARLDILGGEPLLYPRCEELLAGLSRMHTLLITTSLALPIDRIETLLERLSPRRAHFLASFHPEFTSLEDFMTRILLLQSRGFEPGVLIVTWPPLLERLPSYREAFVSRGIPFTPMVFQGRWQGRDYPASFSPEQKAFIASIDDAGLKESEVKYRLDRGTPKGKLCHTGRVYANIKGNGDVYRCAQDAFGQKPLGNIFEPDFQLHKAPQPCPYDTCSCLEFNFLDDVSARQGGACP